MEDVKLISALSNYHNNLVLLEDALKFSGLCRRQFFCRLQQWRTDGPAAVLHGNRGRAPVNRIPDEVRDAILAIATGTMAGAGYGHIHEKVTATGCKVSVSTVTRVCKTAGLKSIHKKRQRKCQPRHLERLPQAGQRLETDGSEHHWFGDDHQKTTIHAYVDSATNTICGAYMTVHETSHGYRQALRCVVEKHGVPVAVRSDRCRHFHSGEEMNTFSQLGDILDELRVLHDLAWTSNGKPRVERDWYTLQTRLPYEFKERGITTIAEANKVLPELIDDINRRFAQDPISQVSAWRQAPADLSEVFARRFHRAADNGGTIAWQKKRYIAIDERGEAVQLKPKEKITISITDDGRTILYCRGRKFTMMLFSQHKSQVQESLTNSAR